MDSRSREPSRRSGDVAEPVSLRFAAAARALGDVARAHGLTMPTFRSPPRLAGRLRTVRRHARGSATVAIVLRDRPWPAVLADMIDGVLAVNGLADVDAERARDRLWAAFTDIDMRAHAHQPAA